MIVSYKLLDRKKSANLEREYYEVLAYGPNLFLVANDNLFIRNYDPTVFEIINDDSSKYVKKQLTLYNNEQDFYIHKKFEDYLTNYDDYLLVTSREVWNRSKLANFFINNGYTIPDNYKKTVLNIDYKMNLIEGFLIFANSYIDRKFGNDHYREAFDFYKTDNLAKLIEEKKDFFFLDKKKYAEHFKNFIKETLWDEKPNEEKSNNFRFHLFKLIDAIFLSDISGIQRIKTFYDDCFVIEYENKFYVLNKYWWG